MSNQKWFVGVDWGNEEHATCLLDEAGKVLGEKAFPHSGTGLANMCSWLLDTTKAEASALFVAIETPHGPVVETLLERGMVVHSINPKQLDRFRDRFTVAGAKDDRRDARVLADSLRTDTNCFRLLRLDDPLIIELREWSRMHDDLQQERVRLTNRLRDQLLRYYPQMLELGKDLGDEPFLALWKLLPTPKAAARVKERQVAALLVETRIRRYDAKHVLTVLRQPALKVAPGAVEAATAHIQVLSERIQLLNRQLKTAERKLDALTEQLSTRESEPGQKCEQRDVGILQSLPGVGRIVLATLLTEASQPLANRDYHALRALSGVAPVTKSSGKKSGKNAPVSMRRACSSRLREATFHWAKVAVQKDAKSAAAYEALKARGHSYGRCLRSIADRLLKVACAMLVSQTKFDVNRRLVA